MTTIPCSRKPELIAERTRIALGGFTAVPAGDTARALGHQLHDMVLYTYVAFEHSDDPAPWRPVNRKVLDAMGTAHAAAEDNGPERRGPLTLQAVRSAAAAITAFEEATGVSFEHPCPELLPLGG